MFIVHTVIFFFLEYVDMNIIALRDEKMRPCHNINQEQPNKTLEQGQCVALWTKLR